MFLDEGFASFHFQGVQEIDFGNFQGKGWFEVNGMVIGLMQGKFVVGLFREHIGEDITPFQENGFLSWHFLGDLSRYGDLSNGFSGKPLFPFSKSLSSF